MKKGSKGMYIHTQAYNQMINSRKKNSIIDNNEPGKGMVPRPRSTKISSVTQRRNATPHREASPKSLPLTTHTKCTNLVHQHN